MADFTPQIKNFEKNGSFVYQFDEVGNVILNPSSSKFQQNYISIPLSNINYNYNKISSFYDTTFTEFIKPPIENIGFNEFSVEAENQISSLESKNQDLQNQLDQLISANEQNSSAATNQAIKDVIISLRIASGQGTSSEDFESEFPYLPIPLENKDNAP